MNIAHTDLDAEKEKNELTIINTNARSLCPKIDSLVECFGELQAQIAVVTETWFRDGPALDEDLSDLEHATGLAALTLNRPPNPNTGVSHGGVAVFFKKSFASFKKVQIPNPDNFEVLPLIGTMRGSSRKIVVLAVYIPPNYLVPRGRQCLEYIETCVMEVKNKFRDPYIVVAGDVNQWDLSSALQEFPDLSEVAVGPTRGDREIDRLFCNMTRGVTESGTVPPLETESDEKSDHRIAYVTTKLPRREEFEWVTYTYRHFTQEAEADFGSWVVMHDWSSVLQAVGSDNKAAAFQSDLDLAMDVFFPLRTTRRKSTDLPWINRAIKKRIRRRYKIYKKEGRSPLWKRLKKTTDRMIRERRDIYMNKKKIQLTAEDANRSFFRLVKAFNTPEKPQNFDVRTLCPGRSDSEVAEELAVFFNRISAEFDPLAEADVPRAPPRTIPFLQTHEVASRIKHFRKPKSMVKGDLFPSTVTKFSDFLAIPLCNIYNEVISTHVWPVKWKVEYVTIIPKTAHPESFGDLRNISCTLLASKILESYVLEWAMEEVATKTNQYGGVKGCSGTHMIMKVWQKILANLEDRRAATILTSIDYAKAFNRLSFQKCLTSFAKLGATLPILKLLATFLTDRTMCVRVQNSWSAPRPVTGGCPQGSILGVFLFNVTTDDLEEDSPYILEAERPVIEIDDGFLNARADNPEDHYRPGWDSESASGSSDGSFHTANESFDSEGSDQLELVSSPMADPPDLDADLSPIPRADVLDVRLSDRDNNPATRRVIYSSEEDLTPPPEPTSTCLGAWHQKQVEVDKYVDDNLQEECVSFENAPESVTGGVTTRNKHAVGSQNAFRHIVRRAEAKGMKVNTSKTGLLCVSDALNFRATAYIEDRDGNRIESGTGLKVLGWHFSERPTVTAQIESLKKKFRQRYWVLRHLKKNGFSPEELLRVYTSMVRPVADYMQEIYHSMLTDSQDEQIDRLQTHALRVIYGSSLSARRLRDLSGLPTLRSRRIEQCDKFARKCFDSDRFHHWFPLKEKTRSTRAGDEFREDYARCKRLYDSPLFYMRRRMNGKEGKKYGERYKEYRK